MIIETLGIDIANEMEDPKGESNDGVLSCNFQ